MKNFTFSLAAICWTLLHGAPSTISARGGPTTNVPLCTAQRDQYEPHLSSGADGGVIVVWDDDRNSSSDIDIYAQRLDSFGHVLWQLDGESICGAIDEQIFPVASQDGYGGAVIAWRDFRDGGPGNDIYAQRIDANGQSVWATGDSRMHSSGHALAASNSARSGWRGDCSLARFSEQRRPRPLRPANQCFRGIALGH